MVHLRHYDELAGMLYRRAWGRGSPGPFSNSFKITEKTGSESSVCGSEDSTRQVISFSDVGLV